MIITRFVVTALAAALLGGGSAIAQVGGSSPGTTPLGMTPLGITSPLGIGPAGAVGPTGIPLGAMELASPGLSPTISGVLSTGGSAPCATGSAGVSSSTATSPSTGPSSSTGISATSGVSAGANMSGTTSVFDGGGTSGMASPGCATVGSSLAGPAASASSPTAMDSMSSSGRTGIPLGATELGAGGLSPQPLIPTIDPSAPATTLTVSPLASTPVLTPSAPLTLPCVTTTSGGGVGIPSSPGAPLIGQSC
jgi:hypothetical protein